MQNSVDHLNSENIILFDGVCNLCNGVVKFIITRDKNNKFKFAALQSTAGQTLLKKFDLQTTNFTSFVLIKGENYFLKSSAALKMMKELGGIWKLFYVLIVIPGPLRDFVYDLLAKSRYSIFGKRDTCMIPTDNVKERFLP